MDASGAVDTDVDSLVHEFQTSTVPIAVWVGPSGGGARGAAALLALAAGYAAAARRARTSGRSTRLLRRPVAHGPGHGGVEDEVSGEGRRHAARLRGVARRQDDQRREGDDAERSGRAQRTLTLDVHFHKLDLAQQLAHTLDSPWVAYFLFVVGLSLIVFEFFTAGVGIAGFVGACALVGGCFGFSHLPVNFWAVGLLMLGVFGLAIDVQAGGLGAWSFIGAAALTAGSIWLYGGSSQLDPSWWVLVLVIAGSVLFMLSGMTAMVRSRFSTPTIGRDDLVGEMGAAEADVDPDGVVRVRDALWKARTNRATPIKAGDAVRVVSVEGIVLEVEPESGGARDYRASVLTWPFVGRARPAYVPHRSSRVKCCGDGVGRGARNHS